jgi:hypothetical protein
MLRLQPGKYPNGADFVRVYNDYTFIGTYDVVQGGFLPAGCRKLSADEHDAQCRVIQRYITAHIKLAADAAKLYEEL